jgi:hypothetical protein
MAELPTELASENREKRLESIRRLTSLLLDIPQDRAEKNLPLVDHANFLHKFSENNISWKKVLPLYFIKDHIAQSKNNTFAVVREIKKINKDEIIITRNHFYNNFYNEKLPVERIKIRRKVENSEYFVFKSMLEDKFKKEVITLDGESFFTKLVKFKHFRDPRDFLFLQNIYYFRCIEEISDYYRIMNIVPQKSHLVLKDLKYYDFIKNFL